MKARPQFKDLADTSQAQITEIGNFTKSKIDTATEALTKEAIKIGNIVDGMSNDRLEAATGPDPRRGVSIFGSRTGNQSIGRGTRPQVKCDGAPQSVFRATAKPEQPPVSPPIEVASPPSVIAPSEVPSPATQVNPLPAGLPERPMLTEPNQEHVVPAANATEPIPATSERKWWKFFTGKKR